MSFATLYNRHLLRVTGLTLVWVVACCCLSLGLGLSTAEASIMVPEAKVVDVEELLGEVDERSTSTGAASNKSVPADDPIENRAETELARLLAAAASPVEGTTSSSSTTSSGTSGSNICPLASSAAANLSDAELVAWVNGEQRFSLPTPPGNELLRPPRG